ncbi:TetR/AcrR family transcriptional regulator [Azospirillum sp. TSH100]|uniref:TetR/AcrR family transcriptional regulator n=1 Tax=Azospirillum sp. TSH100 TaxID=652764 RepID=UPI000D6E254E|nr:TetR/AcrR family transcriptional regulator [Azospirillum sp. TSH100]QCG90110.1 TetR family transcriptional regulator [Azospirillum sp. TSH100]
MTIRKLPSAPSPDTPPPPPAQRRPKQDRSRRSLERMLQAAEGIIASQGVDALTVAALLHDSQVSNGTFYARFSGKEALVHAVLDRALGRMEQTMDIECARLERADISLSQAIGTVTATLGRQFRESAGLFASLMHLSPNDVAIQERALQTHRRIETMIQRAIEPRLPPANRPRAGRMIAMAHHVLFAVLSERITARQEALSKHHESWDDMQDELATLLTRYLADTGGAKTDDGEATLAEGWPPGAGAAPDAPRSWMPADRNRDGEEDGDAEDGGTGRRLSAYSQRKLDQILAAARTLFTRHGYGTTSMVQVAAEAKVGKATVYSHFATKADLFAAVVAAESRSRLTELVPRPGDGVPETLRRFARQAFELLLNPGTTSKLRMIAAEAERFPELGEIFYAAGPAQLQAALSGFLADAMERGLLRREVPQLAAGQFLALICGELRVRELVGTASAIPPAGRDRVLTSGVDAFLRAYRPDEGRNQN